jgi:molybdopterin molybdotransferase
MLAALGRTSARVFQRPRVAVVATGDELVDSGARLLPGQIRNSNGPGLAAQVLAAGGELFYQAVARDNEASIIEHLTRGLGADILLISGGVSVGAYDFVRPALEALTVKILFWRVRQRPGKPLAFGRSETAAVFGLPGNPVSSAVCFEQYVRPAIRQFAGDVGRGRTVRALLEEPIEKKSDLYYFARGVVRYDESGTLVVRLAGEQGSNIYSSMVRSNCMIHLPEGVEAYAAGDQVRVEPYSWSGV